MATKKQTYGVRNEEARDAVEYLVSRIAARVERQKIRRGGAISRVRTGLARIGEGHKEALSPKVREKVARAFDSVFKKFDFERVDADELKG